MAGSTLLLEHIRQMHVEKTQKIPSRRHWQSIGYEKTQKRSLHVPLFIFQMFLQRL